jgi:hypothetical protein
MTPLQLSLKKLEEVELITKDSNIPSGLIKKEDVIKILEEFEVDCLNQEYESSNV